MWWSRTIGVRGFVPDIFVPALKPKAAIPSPRRWVSTNFLGVDKCFTLAELWFTLGDSKTDKKVINQKHVSLLMVHRWQAASEQADPRGCLRTFVLKSVLVSQTGRGLDVTPSDTMNGSTRCTSAQLSAMVCLS